MRSKRPGRCASHPRRAGPATREPRRCQNHRHRRHLLRELSQSEQWTPLRTAGARPLPRPQGRASALDLASTLDLAFHHGVSDREVNGAAIAHERAPRRRGPRDVSGGQLAAQRRLSLVKQRLDTAAARRRGAQVERAEPFGCAPRRVDEGAEGHRRERERLRLARRGGRGASVAIARHRRRLVAVRAVRSKKPAFRDLPLCKRALERGALDEDEDDNERAARLRRREPR